MTREQIINRLHKHIADGKYEAAKSWVEENAKFTDADDIDVEYIIAWQGLVGVLHRRIGLYKQFCKNYYKHLQSKGFTQDVVDRLYAHFQEMVDHYDSFVQSPDN